MKIGKYEFDSRIKLRGIGLTAEDTFDKVQYTCSVKHFKALGIPIDKVKFKQKVLPGDTLIFKCSLITPIRRGICHMQGYAYANGKLCVEAELMAQISKIK